MSLESWIAVVLSVAGFFSGGSRFFPGFCSGWSSPCIVSVGYCPVSAMSFSMSVLVHVVLMVRILVFLSIVYVVYYVYVYVYLE